MDDHTYYRKYVRVQDISNLIVEEVEEDAIEQESSISPSDVIISSTVNTNFNELITIQDVGDYATEMITAVPSSSINDVRLSRQNLFENIEVITVQEVEDNETEIIHAVPSSSNNVLNLSRQHICAIPEEINHATKKQKTAHALSRTNTPKYIRRIRHDFINICRYSWEEFNENDIQCLSLGPMETKCLMCQAKHFACEMPSDGKFSNCCHKGRVPVHNVKYPDELKNILLSNKSFRYNIRTYNSSLSFASFGANIQTVAGRGPQCLRVHGQICHRTSHMRPRTGTSPKYSQLYILDTEEALNIRQAVSANQSLDPILLQQLDTLIRNINPYAASYKMLKEVEEESMQGYTDEGQSPNIYMVIRRDRQVDVRTYNLPRCNEIAAIFTNTDGEPPFHRDFQIYPRSPNRVTIDISIISCNLDPMTYVLLFPFGTPGWQPNMPMIAAGNSKRKSISMLQYKVSLTAIRDDYFNPILNAGKLTQQWIIDSYLQVEANNLNYIRQHQTDLRCDSYKNMRDYMQNDHRDGSVGKTIILPSNFQGSPRNMREKYLDAMAIVAKFGPPDLFITFTCNPRWEEIQNNINSGQNVADRPDIVARVFRQKLKCFLDDIQKHQIFGEVEAFVYTIEFQKRGLPHCHMLIILRDNHKINGDILDNVISAELPDKNKYPRLFDIVTRNMLHGPCGTDNPVAPCMENNVCSKKYPRPFNETTIINADGYPTYKRPNNGATVKIGNHTVDNRYVVPYNKFLSLKYDAHINVEFCGSVSSVKYIYKYVYKGYDRARVQIQIPETDENTLSLAEDEISQYMDARYISAPEAMWRLLENKMHDISHAIIRLAVHLPDEQSVTFSAGSEQQAVDQIVHKNTTLLAWFHLNQTDAQANRHLYSDIPQFYVFKNGEWQARQRFVKPVISRMYSVHPVDSERFYLRTLLLRVRGAKSYEDIRTHNCIVYGTFKEAAIAHGVVNDDNIWDKCFQEASIWQMPNELRSMLCYIIVFGYPENVNVLWEKYKKQLSEDYLLRYNEEISFHRALHDINVILKEHSTSCLQVGLPSPPEEYDCIDSHHSIAEECDVETLIHQLNFCQMNAFTKIMNALENQNETNCFFLDGPGGSGKTFLYNVVLKVAKSRGYQTIATATTGIAATLLHQGQTVHRAFKLPVPLLDTSTSHIKLQSNEAKYLKHTKLIVIDECTMLHKYGYHCIHDLLCAIMKNKKPFGGVVVLIGGDFRQTLPVVTRGSRSDIVEVSLKRSHLWSSFETLSLVDNMRSGHDKEFSKWLLNVGNGTLPGYSNLFHEYVHLPAELICHDDIIDKVYGSTISNSNISDLASKIVLTPTNKSAIKINNRILDLIPHPERVYHSCDSIISENSEDMINYPIEFLNSITASGLPPHELKLKVGCIIILLRNLSPRNGLCNGTRLIVKGLHDHCINAQIITGSNIGNDVLLPKIRLTPHLSLPFKFERVQFPVLPAFAITINKSQGQTFDRVGIYLDEPVFSHGQLYTALSRVKDKNNLFINIDHQIPMLNENNTSYTKNIVFPEIYD